jgi:hypothetical protein
MSGVWYFVLLFFHAGQKACTTITFISFILLSFLLSFTHADQFLSIRNLLAKSKKAVQQILEVGSFHFQVAICHHPRCGDVGKGSVRPKE